MLAETNITTASAIIVNLTETKSPITPTIKIEQTFMF